MSKTKYVDISTSSRECDGAVDTDVRVTEMTVRIPIVFRTYSEFFRIASESVQNCFRIAFVLLLDDNSVTTSHLGICDDFSTVFLVASELLQNLQNCGIPRIGPDNQRF